MKQSKNTKQLTRIGISVPNELLQFIDKYTEENFISRSKWFIDAAKEKMERDNLNRLDKIIRR